MPDPRCASGAHLWASWRTDPPKRNTHVDRHPYDRLRDQFTLGAPYTPPPYTVCLRSGCTARMDLETTAITPTEPDHA